MSTIVLVSVSVMLSFVACNTSHSQSSSWSIILKTSGGFSGRGNGDVLIDSDGHISYQKTALPNNSSVPCKGTVSKENLDQLKTAIEQIKPEGWNVRGLAIAAPDAFGYDLTVRKGDHDFHLQWFDNTAAQLTGDVKGLMAIIGPVKDKLAGKCNVH